MTALSEHYKHCISIFRKEAAKAIASLSPITAFLNLQCPYLWALGQPVFLRGGGRCTDWSITSCVAAEKDEKCFLLNGLVLSRWGWLLISQQLLCFPVSLPSLLLSVTSCQSAPIFFYLEFIAHCSESLCLRKRAPRVSAVQLAAYDE